MSGSNMSTSENNKHHTKDESCHDADRLGYETSGTELQVLEPRVLLDAAGYVTATDAIDQAVSDEIDTNINAALEGKILAPWSADKTLNEQALFQPAIQNTAAFTEYVFADSQVEDLDTLLSSFDESVQVIILAADKDGVEQIAAALNGQTDIDAIHILSHGRAGTLDLGSTKLTQASMTNRHADELSIIRDALSENADILIYGCDFARGARGEGAVATLANLTGADVAASNDLTGVASLNGDWDLEVEVGEIETNLISAENWEHTLASTVLNGGGGQAADGSDGLAIHVIQNGQLQVEFKGATQLYEPSVTDDSAHLFNGVYLAIGNTVAGGATDHALTGTYNGPANGPGIAITDVTFIKSGQTITGSGSGTDPFIVTTTMFYDAGGTAGTYNSATDFQVEITTTYITPNPYFTQSVTITPPNGNTDPVKFYHTIDTFLNINVPAGDNPDEGPAFVLNQSPGNPSVVGVARDADGDGSIDSFTAFAEAQGGEEFDQYYSAQYNGADLYGGTVSGQGIDNGGDIVNTLDFNPSTDNGLGIQFNLDNPGQTQTFEYHIAFRGEATIDLDADDSSGATGSAYTTTFDVGSLNSVPIVDSDVSIQNVVGDIQEVRIEIGNAETGDTLTINAANLPAGVGVQSQTATQIILEATGLALSESTFDLALQELGFLTTSTVESTRGIDFAVTNEIGEEGVASAGGIVVAAPPNTSPIAQDDNFITNEDTDISNNLFANNGNGADSDADSDPFTVTEINGIYSHD